jgi:hypothetical protein
MGYIRPENDVIRAQRNCSRSISGFQKPLDPAHLAISLLFGRQTQSFDQHKRTDFPPVSIPTSDVSRLAVRLFVSDSFRH